MPETRLDILDCADPAVLRKEVIRLGKINHALMNRVERAASSQGSAFNTFQTTIMLEGQVRQRTEELKAALAENEKINRALQAAQAQMQRVNQQLEQLSITDELTQMPNRRRLIEVLSTEVERAGRTQSPLSVAMVDIDQFKQYNDYYGHLAGDDCLRLVAGTLSQLVRTRAGDLAARYGGEEFALVFPGCDSASAEAICRRVCESIRALQQPHAKSDRGHVTISIGVACTEPGQEKISGEQLIERADQALYQAKRSGRDRVVADLWQ